MEKTVGLNEEERLFIADAFHFLSRPGFLMRAAHLVGKPVERVIAQLPMKQQNSLRSIAQNAMKKGLVVVVKTVQEKHPLGKTFASANASSRRLGLWHSAASFGLGAAGGFFGMFSLPVELPMTTGLMLRSVLATAVEFGMDLNDPQVQLECLYILSLGAPQTGETDAIQSAYWTSRAAFTRVVADAATFLVGKSATELARDLERHTASALVRLLATLAARFELVVSEKLLVEAVPILGAVGGGMINAAFTDYFSEAARFHFGLRALEGKHGREAIEEFYQSQSRIS